MDIELRGKHKGFLFQLACRFVALFCIAGLLFGGETAYAKQKTSPKVKELEITGSSLLRPGRNTSLRAVITPRKAANNRIIWKSSNPRVVSVTSGGRLHANREGYAKITARAMDGSRETDSITVAVYKSTDNKARKVAHRGLAYEAPENTKTAFELAGQAGFWGAECDIWETKHAGDGSFDLAICHNQSVWGMTGRDKKVKELTASQLAGLKVIHGNGAEKYDEHICFLRDFLNICNEYEMAPVIELKDKNMSRAGYRKVINELRRSDLLDQAIFISLKAVCLKGIKREVQSQKDTGVIDDGYRPSLVFLSTKTKPGACVTKILQAKMAGFNGIGFNSNVKQEVFMYADALGMKTDVWGFSTFRKSYYRTWTKAFSPTFVTMDGKL